MLHVDGTSLAVKDKDSPKGIVVGALWGYVGDTDTAVFLYTSTGKKLGQQPGEIGPEQFLAARKGPIVADAANLFDKTFQSADRFEVGCNMHSRRYFVRALDANDLRAAVPIAAFKALYDVEDTARDMEPDGRLAERQARSKPVYDELLKWCRKHYPSEPPSTQLAKAIKYVLNQEVALTRFLDDGRLPIDNGIVEPNSIASRRGTRARQLVAEDQKTKRSGKPRASRDPGSRLLKNFSGHTSEFL